MVRTVIGGIEVQDYISSYRVENPAVYGDNSFTDINGEEVQDKRGDKVILNISLIDVPTPVAEKIATVLQQESIGVAYTTPAPASNTFKKTNYSAECSDADPAEEDYDITDGVKWDISVTLESLDFNTASGSGGGYL